MPKLTPPKKYTETRDVFFAEIENGALHVYGTKVEWQRVPVQFDRIFQVGDYTEFGSYNLVYYGKILKITEKTVTIDTRGLRQHNKRFGLFEFIRINWNFDLGKARQRNSTWMD